MKPTDWVVYRRRWLETAGFYKEARAAGLVMLVVGFDPAVRMAEVCEYSFYGQMKIASPVVGNQRL